MKRSYKKKLQCKRGHLRTADKIDSWGGCITCRRERKPEEARLSWAKQTLKSRQESLELHILKVKKRNCKRCGVEFSLSIEDISPLPKFCPILGIELNYFSSKTADDSPSIDRFDCSKGYVSGNVKVISNRANRIKNNGSAEELEKIAQYMKGENA